MNLRELFQKSEPSVAELTAAMKELHSRELEIRARRNELADQRRTLVVEGSAEELIAADHEVLDIETELDQIASKVPHLQAQIDRAEAREAVERTANLVRELPALTRKAESARQAWEAASAELAGTIAELEQQRQHAKREKFQPERVPPKLFDRVSEVLDWVPRRADRGGGIAAENKPNRLWRHKAGLLDEFPPQDRARGEVS